MNKADVESLELGLSLTLPSFYRNFLLNYPYLEMQGNNDWSAWDDPEMILNWTKAYWGGYSTTGCWPNNYICLGDDGDACPYALDINDIWVIKTNKGKLGRKPLEVFPSFQSFLSELDVAYSEYLDLTN